MFYEAYFGLMLSYTLTAFMLLALIAVNVHIYILKVREGMSAWLQLAVIVFILAIFMHWTIYTVIYHCSW